MHRPMRHLRHDDATLTWVGANFWSRSGGPRMWVRYDAALVRDELRVLADHGVRMTRSFFYWPDFHPTPYALDEECLARFADFLDAHVELDMNTVPTFIVGHMSGENWDPAWREGRDLYRDSWFLGRQAWYVRELASRFHTHSAVSGWLLSNEVPIYGGEAPREIVHAWADILIDALRAAGATQPVSVGDGAWGIQTTGHDNGFALADLADRSDFVGPHVYRMEDDQIRQNLKAAYATELCHVGARPVVLEEFGVTTDYVSPDGAGHYYRQQLYNTLLAGATGWIAWNNTDYDDLVAQRPYSHHPFEMHFGITDSRGKPKPPLRELQRFAADLAAMDVAGLRRDDVDAAIVLPSHLAADYPFTYVGERETIVLVGEQAYVAAHAAHVPVAVIREAEDGGIAHGALLYLIPSVKQLCGPTWRQLGDLADRGATVYASYCVGEVGEQRGPWWAYTEELFGVQRQSAYGLVEPIDDDIVVIRFIEAFGPIAAGSELRFRPRRQRARTLVPPRHDDHRHGHRGRRPWASGTRRPGARGRTPGARHLSTRIPRGSERPGEPRRHGPALRRLGRRRRGTKADRRQRSEGLRGYAHTHGRLSVRRVRQPTCRARARRPQTERNPQVAGRRRDHHRRTRTVRNRSPARDVTATQTVNEIRSRFNEAACEPYSRLAETEGFEPSVPVRGLHLSRVVH